MDTDWKWLRADYDAYLKQYEADDAHAGIYPLSFGAWLRLQPLRYLEYHGYDPEARWADV